MLYGNLNRKKGSSLYGDPIKNALTQLDYTNTTPDYQGGAYMQNPASTPSLDGAVSPKYDMTQPGIGEDQGMDILGTPVSEGGLTGKMPNYNAIAYASMLPAIGQSIKDLTAAADRTPLTLANFNEAGSRFDKMGSNLTQAKQDTLAASNSEQFQIDQSSTGGLRNARLQGANSSYRDALGRVAANEQQLRNQVLQTQGQAETNFAIDEANRKTQNITFNEQNKGVTEDIRRQASQNIFNLVGQNANNRQMFEDIKANNLTLQKASTAEGFKFLEMIAQNFGMGGAEEYQAYLEDPNNPEKLKTLMDAFQIKFKETPLEEPTTK